MTKKIVTIGGGTGQYTLLSGLKHEDADICAVVSMADDGGTTGTLRDEMGVLPPSDVRKCIIALSCASPQMRELFGYRFSHKDLEGHTVGNLIISALEKITGNITKATHDAGKIFNIRGIVLPVTDGDMRMRVILKNGKVLNGENALDDNEDVREHGVERIELKTPMIANEVVVRKIKEADMVIIGPGDLYGSVLPNLLVSGVQEALMDTKAKVILVSNLTNKKGQTGGFTVTDHVEKINEYIGKECINTVVYNSQEPSAKLKQKYEDQEGKDMFVECHDSKNASCNIVHQDLLAAEEPKTQDGDTLASQRSFIRHDSVRLAKAIMSIFDM